MRTIVSNPYRYDAKHLTAIAYHSRTQFQTLIGTMQSVQGEVLARAALFQTLIGTMQSHFGRQLWHDSEFQTLIGTMQSSGKSMDRICGDHVSNPYRYDAKMPGRGGRSDCIPSFQTLIGTMQRWGGSLPPGVDMSSFKPL